MLTKCPECELPVSDKAISCPHCGYPLDKSVNIKRKSSGKKRMRLPNGFGQISEIKGRQLRRPFRAMVTVGKNENGRPICKPLKPVSYFETYNDAYTALLEYNKNPYDLTESITIKELYARWYEDHSKSCGESRLKNIRAAWAYCEPLYDMDVRCIRTKHLKECCENPIVERDGKIVNAGSSTKPIIKTLLNMLFDYALEYEMTDKNYARQFNLSDSVSADIENSKKEHITYTEEEMNTLWEHTDDPWVRIILVQCYSGWRPQEILTLKLENIKDGFMTGGMKTEAGKNRKVPIHSKIKPLIELERLKASECGSIFLFNRYANGNYFPISYTCFKDKYDNVMKILSLNEAHRPHDGRKQFISMAKKYHVDEYAIKLMVGHSISDLTEKVYTEREDEWFIEEIEKIEKIK